MAYNYNTRRIGADYLNRNEVYGIVILSLNPEKNSTELKFSPSNVIVKLDNISEIRKCPPMGKYFIVFLLICVF